jgi:pimeloyl-ACP methyl ester carboxylesterase
MPMLKTDGADVYYEVHGSGPPILLIAGTACDGAFWSPYQVPEFSRDHTVIIIDQRGIGKTVLHSDDYSTSRLATDAAEIVRKVGMGPAFVLGHSLGGRVAQLVALEHPDTVKAMALLSTGAGYKAQGGIPSKICLGIIKQGYEAYIREHNINIGFTKKFAQENPARVKECIDVLMNALPTVDIYLEQVNARQWHNTRDRLKDIRVPCLITVGDDEVHGLSDTTHVESAKVLADNIPNASFQVIPNAGHFYMFSHPDYINRLVREYFI